VGTTAAVAALAVAAVAVAGATIADVPAPVPLLTGPMLEAEDGVQPARHAKYGIAMRRDEIMIFTLY
jgi:hypothetical protein